MAVAYSSLGQETVRLSNTDICPHSGAFTAFKKGSTTALGVQVFGYRPMIALRTEAGVPANLKGQKEGRQAGGDAVQKRKRPGWNSSLAFSYPPALLIWSPMGELGKAREVKVSLSVPPGAQSNRESQIGLEDDQKLLEAEHPCIYCAL